MDIPKTNLDALTFARLVAGHLLLLACSLVAGQALAQTSQEEGLAIALEADRRDSGFGDSSAMLRMTLASPGGNPIVREMRQKNLEVAGDGDRTIMVFDRPRDLKGTAVLTHTHKTASDDQWLYLPALKRVKRISSADKSGPFMGSEFAFEDLASQEVEKYSYNYIGEEEVEGDMCFVVERIPIDAKSGYLRQVTWVDQQEYRLRKVDYYDRKGDLLKTMVLTGHQQYLDQFWRPKEMIMHNHQTQKTTTLHFIDYHFQAGMGKEEFSRNGLSSTR